MEPVWDPKERGSKLYREFENPSDGVVTVRYQPTSDSNLKDLEDTEIYRIVDANITAFGLNRQNKKSG